MIGELEKRFLCSQTLTDKLQGLMNTFKVDIESMIKNEIEKLNEPEINE